MARAPRILADLAAVCLFAAVGRLSHDEGLTAAGWLDTGWPFLVGVAAGWALLAALRRDGGSVAGGALIAVATVAVGMVLRRLTGEGTAPAFVAVALVVVGLLVVGSRLVVRPRS